jgi:ribonuclease P/MRP protein subunit POP1
MLQTLRQYVKQLDMNSASSSSEMEIDTDQPNFVFGGTVKTTSSLNGLCLVRVLIRALKEGSFEEGAVICAPLSSDLAAWKTRSVSYISFSFAVGDLHGALLSSSKQSTLRY